MCFAVYQILHYLVIGICRVECLYVSVVFPYPFVTYFLELNITTPLPVCLPDILTMCFSETVCKELMKWVTLPTLTRCMLLCFRTRIVKVTILGHSVEW